MRISRDSVFEAARRRYLIASEGDRRRWKATEGGKVFMDGKKLTKAGTPVSDKSAVEIQAEVPKYVCGAGHNLEAAIEKLDVHVTGKVALDSGLSTGGCTDCLLQHGASFVYGIDVGYGQIILLHISLLLGTATNNICLHRFLIWIIKGVEEFGFERKGWIESPLKAPEGNTEFLIHFTRAIEKTSIPESQISSSISTVEDADKLIE
ncbi:hypothetical protein QQ045_008958 [Rhodiola kirilowii]